jgi:hypothetical protein
MVVEWEKMTPQEVIDALASAPKVAGPWASPRAGKRWRVSPILCHGAYDVGEVNFFDGRYFYVVESGCAEDCESFADGERRVDEALRARGWRLA